MLVEIPRAETGLRHAEVVLPGLNNFRSSLDRMVVMPVLLPVPFVFFQLFRGSSVHSGRRWGSFGFFGNSKFFFLLGTFLGLFGLRWQIFSDFGRRWRATGLFSIISGRTGRALPGWTARFASVLDGFHFRFGESDELGQ